jgi:hypothetical protein
MSALNELYTEEDLNPRYAPPGTYRGFITTYETKTSGQGTEYAVIYFKIEEALSGQDMEGVELGRHLQSRRFYFSKKATPMFLKWVNEIVPLDFPIHAARALEKLPGVECIFDYTVEVNSQSGKTYTQVTAARKP